MAVEARNRSIPEWFTRIRTRQIALPRFQRRIAWGHNLVCDLLTTILRGLPCGSALILEVGDNLPFVSRTMHEAPTEGERITELLLDGQQRLTALWRALNDKFDDRTFLVRMVDDPHNKDRKIPEVIGISRYERNGQIYPLWIDKPKEVWERQHIPVSLLAPGDFGYKIDNWVDNVLENEKEAARQKEREIKAIINPLRENMAVYNIPFLSLPVDTPKEVALDVFIKMNTSMVSLSIFDIIVAQMEAEASQSLHDLMTQLIASAPRVNEYKKAEDLVLDVAALMQGHMPNQTGFWKLDVQRLVSDWALISTNIQGMLSFMEEEKVFDRHRLPTDAVLSVVAALWHELPTSPDALGNAKTLLRKYLWHSFFTDRYEQSAATRTHQDYKMLLEGVKGNTPVWDATIFNEKEHPLATMEQIKAAGWPKNRIILARGIMLLSMKAGARDIADGTPASASHVLGREYHHLFPDSLLQAAGLPSEAIYKATNCALVTWRTNRTISNKEPLTYLKERANNSSLGEGELRQRLKTHLSPYDALSVGGYGDLSTEEQRERLRSDYDMFVTERAQILHAAMAQVCSGRDLELAQIFQSAGEISE